MTRHSRPSSSPNLPRRRIGSAALLSAAVLATACSDDPTGPSLEDRIDEIAVVLVDLRDGSGHVSHTHGVGAEMYWHGDLHLHPGDEVELEVTFLDAAGDTLSLLDSGEITLSAALAPGMPSGVVEVESHGDHLEVVAIGEGEISVTLSLMHDGHADFTTPGLTVEVVDHHGEPGPEGVAVVRLLNHSDETELAHTHETGDDMFWHGHLHLHPGDELEVELEFLDADGDVLEMVSGDRTLMVSLADGSASGVVALAAHGDHADIEALADGEVEVVFTVMDGDEVVMALPGVEVEVVTH